MKLERKGLETLAAESVVRSKKLEVRLFKSLDSTLQIKWVRYFMVSVDLKTDLYYAPISSVAGNIFEGVVANDNNGRLLEEIRNEFPVSQGGRGFVAALIQAMKAEKTDSDCILAGYLDDDGGVTKLVYWSTTGLHINVPDRVNAVRDQHQSIDPLINARIEGMRNGDVRNQRKVLIIRHDIDTPSDAGRVFDLYQIGFVFYEGRKVPRSVIKRLFDVARVSSFATASLLYDRERYFQRAVRQAVRGSIIKFGEKEDLDSQIQMLRDLARNEKCNVPYIEDSDLDSKENSVFTWYKMPRFTMTSLLDLLTSTSGLEKYEVASIVRSCFGHMRETYWLEDLRPDEVDARAYLAVSVALALDRAESACRTILERTANIRSGMPIKFKRGIDLFDRKELVGIAGLLQTLDPEFKGKFKVSISWEGKSFETDCQNPVAALKTVLKAIQNLPDKTRLEKCCIHNGVLHGDAHFGNILMDASVPEDPLIVSIDPKQVDYSASQKKESLYKYVSELCSRNDFDKEIQALAMDPIYDVAKFMFSSSCAYGLAYRRAFDISASDGPTSTVCKLIQVPKTQISKLSEVGGISGSQLVAMDAPVVADAWRYHWIAADVTLRECVSLFHEWYEKSEPISVNLGLIRLWLITSRHAFSTCENLYPQDIKRAMTMYLLGVRFLSVAVSQIEECIEPTIGGESRERIICPLFSDVLYQAP